MSWRATFEKGVASFKCGDLQEALDCMNQAAELQRDNFTIYDSRAAVYERLGNLKAALLDSKRVIDLAPDRWQGYARSARLFNALKKYGPATKMADLALSRLRPDEVQRRTQMVELRNQAVIAQAAVEKQRSFNTYLMGKLPVETLVEIFNVLIDQDHTWALRLSHVCGHWRKILLYTPSAWRTLVLCNKRPLRKAKLWMERAQGRIAKISFSMSCLDEDDVLSYLKGLSWNNLSSVRISGKLFVKLHQMLSDISLPHAFSNFQELSLHDLDHPDQLNSLLSGPNWNLESLYLGGSVQMNDEWWQRINQLKELHVCGRVNPFSILALKANPLLERLVLDCTFVSVFNAELDASPALMSNLKSVECRNVPDPFIVINTFVAPSLTSLSLHSIPAKADLTITHLALQPSLVELRISSCNLDRTTLPIVLSETPNLETLLINSVDNVVNDVLEFLTPQNLPLPCSALKHVDLSRCADLTTSNIYAFVKNRLRHGSASDNSAGNCAIIESLTVDGCPKIEPDMLPWFRSKVSRFSCVYMSKKDLKRRR